MLCIIYALLRRMPLYMKKHHFEISKLKKNVYNGMPRHCICPGGGGGGGVLPYVG